MSKYECPEADCYISFDFREEVLAHLDWDHNRTERESEEMLAND